MRATREFWRKSKVIFFFFIEKENVLYRGGKYVDYDLFCSPVLYGRAQNW